MTMYGTRDGKFKVKKLEVRDKVPVSYTIPKLQAVSTTVIVAGWNVSAGTTAKTNLDFLIQPTYPVNLTVNTKVAGTAGSGDGLVFVGYNQFGDKVTETVYVSGTAAETNVTDNCYSFLTSITPDDAVHKSTDVNIGVGSALGMPWPIASSGDILTYSYNSAYATTADYAVGTVGTNKLRPKTLAADATLQVIYKSSFQ